MYKHWHYCNIYKTAEIGDGTKIGSYCEIGDGVKIGKDCIISSFAFTCNGVAIGDRVFVGPRVTFLNDKYPPSFGKFWKKTIVRDDAVIGGGSIILPGVIIGKGAVIGAGSVVTKNVPEYEIWMGNPARFHRKAL